MPFTLDVLKKVQMAQHFSVCMDTTQDKRPTDQLSIKVHYVQSDGCPKEALLSLNAAPKAVTLISGKVVDKALRWLFLYDWTTFCSKIKIVGSQ